MHETERDKNGQLDRVLAFAILTFAVLGVAIVIAFAVALLTGTVTDTRDCASQSLVIHHWDADTDAGATEGS